MQLGVGDGAGVVYGGYLQLGVDGGVGLGLGDEDGDLQVGLGVAAGHLFEDKDERYYCLGALVYDEEFCLPVLMLVKACCNSTACLIGWPPE